MYPKYIGQRIKTARVNLGLSQDNLAQQLGVHRPTISQIESGKRAIDTTELVALSHILKQPLSFFVETDQDAEEQDNPINILYRAEDISENEKPVIDDFLKICKDYIELEEFNDIDKHLPFPFWKKPVRSKREAIEDGERAATSLRRQLELGASPVKDLAAILENHGIKIIYRSLKSSHAWGFSISNKELGHCIFINSSCIRERRLFTLAHELGHIYMDHKHSVTIFSEGNSPGAEIKQAKTSLPEVRANVFAAAFLMPKEKIEKLLENSKFKKNDTSARHIIRYLCHYFGVSYPAMVYRLYNLNYIGNKVRDELLQNPITSSLEYSEPEEIRFPERYFTLALEAYRSMRISIGKLADYLRIDLYNARRIIKELGIQQTRQ